MTRLFTSLVFACTLALLGACSRSNEKPTQGAASTSGQKQPVEVAPIEQRRLEEVLSVVGSIAANESAVIRAEIAGHVRAVYFDEGQRVTRDQVLLKIDDSELLAQFAQSEARFKLAELNLARNQGLLESKTVSQADFDRVSTEQSASAAELSLLRVRLAKTEIKAPFDGIVGARTISPGDYVTQASAITQIDDLSRLKIDFQVPERYLGKVKSGAPFTVRAKTIDATTVVRGEVYFVSSVIDRNTRSSAVKGILTDPPADLKPGMFANVELVLDVRENAMTVPEGAVMTSVRGPQLIAVKEENGEKVADFIPVRLGLRARGFVEILSSEKPFEPDQQIVAAGVGSLILFPGAKLDPRPLRADFQPAD